MIYVNDMSAISDGELRLYILRLARRIRSHRSADVSDPGISILFTLERDGARLPSELAAQEHVSRPAINRTLNSLERDGYIERSPDWRDGRKVVVRLTKAGMDRATETRALRTAWFSRRLAELTVAEREALHAAAPVIRRLSEQ